MGLFSGSKKTKSSTTTTTTASTGYGQAQDSASVIAGLTAKDGSRISVSTSDHGALLAARDIALRGIDVGASSIGAVLAGAREQTAEAFGLVRDAQAGDAGEFRKLVMIGAALVGVVFISAMFKRG